MNKLIRKSLDFLLFSNVFIALCAVAQGLLCYRLLKVEPDKLVLGVLFCSTLAMYNYSILLSKPTDLQYSALRCAQWGVSHRRLTATITLLAILPIMPLAFFLALSSQILLFILALISFAYNLPLFRFEQKKFGLRNIPGIKFLLISLVWSLSCVLLPILELEKQQIFITVADTILLIAAELVFIAAITIPFDIRDLFQDREDELKTIPVRFGEKKAYRFCFTLLSCYLTLLYLFTGSFNADFIALAFSVVLAGWIIFKSNWKKNEYYYFLYLDGIMIIQYLFIATIS